MFSPTVDSVAEEREDIKVGKINIDENIELANQFGVASIPTLSLCRMEGKSGQRRPSFQKDVLKMLDA